VSTFPYMSVSRMGTLGKCALQARYRYVDQIPERSSGSFLFGKVFHSVVEMSLREILLSKSPTLDQLLAAITPTWNKLTAEEEGASGFLGWSWSDDDSPERATEELPGVVRIYHSDVMPTLRPRLVEHKFSYELPSNVGPFEVFGFIDLIEDDWSITDWKTANGKVSPFAKKPDSQLPGYAVWVAREASLTTVEARKVWFVRGRKARIEKAQFRIGAPAMDFFRAQAASMWQMVEANAWPANTNGWWCSQKFCSFYEGCQGELS
jgi:hypothetical protein